MYVGKKIFAWNFHVYEIQFSNVKCLENLIGWTLTNTGEVTLELNLSRLQCHPNARDATLVPALYCEPTYKLLFYKYMYVCIYSKTS